MFIYGISTILGNLMPKPFSKKDRNDTIQPIAGRISPFPKGI